MLTRRLMVAGGSGASFVGQSVRDLTEIAFWNDIAEPRAVYYNGKTYIGWVTEGGDIKVAAYTHATATLGSPFTLKSGLSASDGNIHLSISLCVRASDKRIVAVYSANSGTKPFRRISTNPEDVSAWGSESTILDAGVVYTYGSLYQVTNGTLYYITRRYEAPTFFVVYGTSSDGGDTWSASATKILQPDSTAATYWRALVDGSRIHIFTSDTDRDLSTPSSIYHVILDGSTLRKSDNSAISGPYPVASSAGTLVQGTADGTVQALGGSMDGSDPAVLLGVWNGTTLTFRVGRWTGSAWSVSTVTSTTIVGSNRFVGSGAIDKANPNALYLPIKVGSVYELYRYLWNGSSWDGTALTTGSGSSNAMPDTVYGAAAGLAVVYGFGTYTSDSNFDFTLRGYG